MSNLRVVADLMVIAARTAPKSAGQDFVVTHIVENEQVQELAKAMLAFGQRTGKRNFDRDGKNVAASDCVVLIGIKDGSQLKLDCAACGAQSCDELLVNSVSGDFSGPQCAFRLLDMGVALGSAAKVASMMNVDNRIMYRAGVVAREMGLIDADYVMGIPLSATGKSIYFDR